MKLTVIAKPGSREPSIVRRGDGVWVVRVRERAVDNKANEAIEKAIAAELRRRRSQVRIVRGHSGSRKVVEVIDE